MLDVSLPQAARPRFRKRASGLWEAAPLGQGRGLGLALGQSVGGATPLTLSGYTQLKSWHRTSYGLVFDDDMLTAGTGTPPVIQIVGTPNGLYDVLLRTTTGGGRGAAIFEWSINGGISYTPGAVTAPSVALGSTGLSALCSGTGTYTIGDTYRSTVQQWRDSSPNNVLFEETVGPANQPLVALTGVNGRPALGFDGVGNRLKCFDAAFATALLGGSDTPVTVFVVGKIIGAASGNHPLFGISYDALGTAQLSLRCLTNQWVSIKRGDSDASDTRSGGTSDNNPHVFELVHFGTTVSVLVDGSLVISAAAQDRATCTVAAVTLGSMLSVANVFGQVAIGEVITYAGALTSDQRLGVRNYCKGAWAL